MALTFFARCEGSTLDGTHDFSAGDTTWAANNSPTFDTAGARIGTNGMIFDASAERWDLSTSSVLGRLVGTAAFYFQFTTAFPATNHLLFFARGTDANDYIAVACQGGNSIKLQTRQNAESAVDLTLSTTSLTTGNWYWCQIHWDQPNNDRSIEVYDTSGTLIDSSEDLSTAFTAPDDIITLQVGDSSGWGASSTLYVDNIFVGNAYDDDFYDDRNITSYTEYGAIQQAVGLVTETESALTITPAKLVDLSLVTETESALSMYVNGSVIYLDVAHGRELLDENETPWASVSGWEWAWYDDPDGPLNGDPVVDSGTFNTDANGEVAPFNADGTSLLAGQSGALVFKHPTLPNVQSWIKMAIGP